VQEPPPRTPDDEAAGRHGRKACLLGDTMDSRAIAPLASGCDVLAHESTFLHAMAVKARVATHSTGRQAGTFAANVGARQLVLTHFSGRYEGGLEQPPPPGVAADGAAHVDERVSLDALRREAADAAGGGIPVACACDGFTWRVAPRAAPGDEGEGVATGVATAAPGWVAADAESEAWLRKASMVEGVEDEARVRAWERATGKVAPGRVRGRDAGAGRGRGRRHDRGDQRGAGPRGSSVGAAARQRDVEWGRFPSRPLQGGRSAGAERAPPAHHRAEEPDIFTPGARQAAARQRSYLDRRGAAASRSHSSDFDTVPNSTTDDALTQDQGPQWWESLAASADDAPPREHRDGRSGSAWRGNSAAGGRSSAVPGAPGATKERPPRRREAAGNGRHSDRLGESFSRHAGAQGDGDALQRDLVADRSLDSSAQPSPSTRHSPRRRGAAASESSAQSGAQEGAPARQVRRQSGAALQGLLQPDAANGAPPARTKARPDVAVSTRTSGHSGGVAVNKDRVAKLKAEMLKRMASGR
jgi:hypothetical protein